VRPRAGLVPPVLLAVALAGFLALVQFYTSLAPLSPTPPVGYVFTSRLGAAVLIALLALCSLVAALALVRAGPLPVPSRDILAAWIGACALSSLAGFDPRSGFEVVATMLLGAAFHLALVRYYAQPPVAALVLRVYLWTGLTASVAGIAMLIARRPLLLWVLNHGRAAGFFVTANQFAAFLIMFVFVALGTALATGNAALRLLASIALAAGATALALTFSAAGWLGVVVAGLFFSYALGARRVALGILAAGVLGMAFFVISPAAGHHNPAEATSRLRTWSAGLRVVQLFPLTGAGPMAYWRVYPAVRAPNGDPPGSFGALHPHDVFISLAAETGAIGVLATFLGWYWFVRAVRRDLAAATPAVRRFALGVCAGFVAVLVQGIFDTVGVVALTFVWIPFTALGLAAARYGLGEG
jgi:O-antigen ligase